MDANDKDRLVDDIENRLDDFFGEEGGDTPPAGSPPDTASSTPEGRLEKLKSVVLSIDWEITDQCLVDLVASVDELLEPFQNDPYAHAMLRMLKALGQYIKKRKAQAHPDAIKRVMSVYKSLEQITASDVAEQRKKAIVATEIRRFKQLKAQVSGKPVARTPAPGAPAAGEEAIRRAVAEATAELRKEISELKDQIRALKSQLRQMGQTAS